MNKWFSDLRRDTRHLTPARAVTHPAWIAAVFVLLVNDHVIKPAALLEPLAGKVSDVAGMFLFPVLLATLIGVRTRRGLWLTGAATAIVFATINLSTTLAAGFDAAVSLVVPFSTTVDPTDLIALLAIPVGLAFFEPLMLTTSVRRTRRALEAAAVTVGALASMATSSPPCDDCNDITQSAQVSILNKTNELHILRIRTLRAGMRLKCDLVQADPIHYLVDGAFDAPLSWFVQSGQEIPIDGGQQSNDCLAALVESDTAPNILVLWSRDLPAKSFAFDVDVPREIPADGQTIVLDADYSRAVEAEMHQWRDRSDCGERADLCGDDLLAPLATIPTGARYFWRDQHTEPLHFDRPSTVQGTLPTESAACVAPSGADGIAWEPPPSGELYVVDVEEGRDGCHEITLMADVLDETRPTQGWWLCAPYDALAALVPTPTAQKRIVIAIQSSPASGGLGGYQGLEISVFTLGEFTALDTIHLVRGYSLPDAVRFDYRFVPIDECGPQETDCGQIALPVEVELTSYDQVVRPGESAFVGEVQPLEIHIVRAEARPVVDTTCASEGSNLAPPAAQDALGYMEAVIVRRDGGR